jgi:hypothetical protein
VSNRLNSTPAAQATRTELARAGKLGLTKVVGEVQPQAQTPRRRVPSMPRATLDNRPTQERTAKAPEGIEVASGTKAHRIRNPLETHKGHFSPGQIEAALRYLRLRASVETAASVTAAYNGMPGRRPGTGEYRGGVQDTKRADAAELAFVEAKLEPEFKDLLDLLVVGVDAHLSNRPKTVGDIARAVLGYRGDHTATSCGVGMLWGSLVRLASLFVEIRMGGERKTSTAEQIALRLQERRRAAATAQAQFHRERRARNDEGAYWRAFDYGAK